MNRFLDSKYLFPATAFVIAVVFQLFCIGHGFDLTDEGFLYSMYQHFGDDVNACKGGSGYPLTCYLGWCCYSLFPQGGIYWLRLCGVFLVTFTAIAVYLMLRKICNQKILAAALLAQVFVVCSDPKPLGYNTLTAVFAIAVAAISIKAVKDETLWPFIPAGFLAALSFYLRLPNIAFAAFILLPFCNSKISTGNSNTGTGNSKISTGNSKTGTCSEKTGTGNSQRGGSVNPLRRAFGQAFCFGGGYIVGAAAGWAIMMVLGADTLIIDFFKSLFSTLNGESTHSSSSMLKTIGINYLKAATLLTLFIAALWTLSRKMNKYLLIFLSIAFAWLFYFILYLKVGVLAENQMALLNGVGLGGCIYLFIKRPDLRTIAAAAILISLLCPFGSDRGFVTVWTGTWLLFPLGIFGIYEGMKSRAKGSYERAFAILLAILCLCTFLKSEKRAYYDGRSRLKKQYAIESEYSKGIKTTELRADVTNGLLEQLKVNGVAEGDTIFVYASSPMIYFLTDTKPFAGVSWPCLQYGDQYVETFSKAASTEPKPRIIVIQNFNGLGSSQEWQEPTQEIMSSKKGWEMATANMNKSVISYLNDNSYKWIWTNGYYDIYEASNRFTIFVD